jgi:hypothetical protein
LGHAKSEEGLYVGVEKAAAFVWRSKYYETGSKMRKSYAKRTVEGYKGTMNSELVPVGNMPTAFLALMAELAAAGFPEELELALEGLFLWRVARIAATTAPAITRMPIGTPNLNHLLVARLDLGCAGVI